MNSTSPVELREKWLKQMGSTHIHSAWGQLWRMIYSDLNLRTISFIADKEPGCPFKSIPD